MKLRIVLKTSTKKGKAVSIKFNVTPSKHLGFINFINLALTQNKSVKLSLEKIDNSGNKEENLIEGIFNLNKIES
ncbi:MAG: hypothetical protein MUP85_19555 [Candidatus Lokiarchaeota archaeon]|jgi:hypothetical protein|nr:hypothetical protein [Candidatus Lokiarchaeota archaeon]